MCSSTWNSPLCVVYAQYDVEGGEPDCAPINCSTAATELAALAWQSQLQPVAVVADGAVSPKVAIFFWRAYLRANWLLLQHSGNTRSSARLAVAGAVCAYHIQHQQPSRRCDFIVAAAHIFTLLAR
jgi:hypothetical protein